MIKLIKTHSLSDPKHKIISLKALDNNTIASAGIDKKIIFWNTSS